MCVYTEASPCRHCIRGRKESSCEDKRCPIWRRWYLARWNRLRQYPRAVMERTVPVGVPLGGRHYASPDQVRSYLQKNPCESCVCPSVLCSAPCRVRQAWDRAKKEVLQ